MIGGFTNPILQGGTAVSMNVDFSASTQSTDAGATISFTNLSTTTPLFNFWDFGDGSFSTASAPDKIYNTSGTFSVTLNACDNISGGIETKNDYIFIEKVYLLDLESAAVAYSVRKLKSDYTGPCIKIRNSLNNEQDIYFVDDYVDINSINTFRNLGTGFASVSVIYDQSGNGFDLTGSSTAHYPVLADSSSSFNLYTNNGILSMVSKGRMYNTSRLTAYDGIGEVWFNSIVKPTSNTTEGLFIHVAAGSKTYGLNSLLVSQGWRCGGRRLSTDSFDGITEPNYNNTFHNLMTRFHYNNNSIFIYENNLLVESTTSFQTPGVTDTTESKNFGIGANIAAPQSVIFSGEFSEIVLFIGSINKDIIYSNQKSFYNLT